MSKRLENKIAVITGAASGFGKAMLERFAVEGAKIVAVDVDKSVEELGSSGQIVPVVADVSKPEHVESIYRACREHFGRLDILCNNAGVGGVRAPLHEYPMEIYDRVFSINVRGAFIVLQGAIKMMLENGGGSVVNTSSTGGSRVTPKISAYIMSKGAMNMMTKQAAVEYAKAGIRVNAVCPGVFQTPMMSKAKPKLIASLKSKIPMGHLGQPHEMANLALFLASDEASHITGQCYIIDGGRSAL